MNNTQFDLQFDLAQVPSLARSYWVKSSPIERMRESRIEDVIAPQARRRGYMTRDEFLFICEWKSSRPRKLFQANDEASIQNITRKALETHNEQQRIETLVLLRGVGYPVASVILHWCAQESYPILDWRALESLGIEKQLNYTFDFWWSYTQFCRELAQRGDVTMRILDRALWQFSKDRSR